MMMNNRFPVYTKDDCNMPEGLISVSVLASNLALWIGRGYKITTA